MRHLLIVVSTAALLSVASIAMADDKATADAREAVMMLKKQQDVAFAYQRFSNFGDRSMLERYQPQADDHGWTLLAENGDAPSSQRTSEYQQMKRDEWYSGQQNVDTEAEDQQSIKLSLSELIQVDSINYQGARQWQGESVRAYTFTPMLDKFSEHSENLQGHLYLAPDKAHLQGIAISLKEEFSPAMSVTLEAFDMRIELMALQQGDRTFFVPKQTEEKMSGSYLFFKDFGSHTVREYSDYSVLSSAEKPAATN